MPRTQSLRDALRRIDELRVDTRGIQTAQLPRDCNIFTPRYPCQILVRVTCPAVAATALLACVSPTGPDIHSYAVEARVANLDLTNGANGLSAQAGDVVQLDVMGVSSDGTRVALPEGAQIAWSGLPSMTANEDPAPGSVMDMSGAEQALMVNNPVRFVTNEGSALIALLGPSEAAGDKVQATVSGVGQPASLDVVITASPSPAGDAAQGQELFVANCSVCHGTSGEGITGPGLDANGDNMAADPAWNSALFAVAARVDMDDQGVPLQDAMPTWLTHTSASGRLLTTQDFADMYAFLKTQTK